MSCLVPFFISVYNPIVPDGSGDRFGPIWEMCPDPPLTYLFRIEVATEGSGSLVFETTNVLENWDGRNHNDGYTFVPNGNYGYRCEVDDEVYTGIVLKIQ